MIAADAGDPLIDAFMIGSRPAGDEDARALLSELVRDASANTSGGSSHDGDFTV
jgi:hypothetical protein